TSKAAYLHGSFGSGKSHFMAALYLLLQQNVAARSIPKLAPVGAKHDEWMQGKKFFFATYYLIGGKEMEPHILGGYVKQIERIHPTAPTPGVYRADALFQDAERLRKTMGDEKFFSELNKGHAESTGSSGWGEISAGWDAEGFAAAMAAPPKAEERVRL